MAPTLDEVCPVVAEMVDSRTAITADGQRVAMHSNISRPLAETLFDMVVARAPKLIVEVGMAFGTSTLTMLAAQEAAGVDGRVITIDPMQTSAWNRNGVAAVQRAGYAGRHQLIEEFDFLALPRLLEAGTKPQFAYIDGWHTFDYTLLDWWYIDRMLDVGGVVGFNDSAMPAVDRVISFVETHRDYAEIDTVLEKLYKKPPLRELKDRITHVGRRRPKPFDRYFEKTSTLEPAWDFYAEF